MVKKFKSKKAEGWNGKRVDEDSSESTLHLFHLSTLSPFILITLLALIAIGVMWWRSGDFISLWLTPDQQGRWHYQNLEFPEAMEKFEDPTWRGIAAYRSGKYEFAAASFAQNPSAEGFFNMGDALMKNKDYGKAIQAFELAVNEGLDWKEAQENLELARYVLEYIETSREQSDTGDESELGADEFKFDNTKKKGKEIEITEKSAMKIESAEKWMRSVDTQTRDFLRIRFSVENSRRKPQ